MSERKTPLYERHAALGGKIVPFADYLLPVQYTGVIAEHMAVRTNCGLFDVSHMGEALIRGKDAMANVQKLVTVNVAEMTDGQVKYTPMCNDQGGVVDDILVYRVAEDCYYLVINAANRFKDVDWMRQKLFGEATLTDISDSVGQVALQGPNAIPLMKELIPDEQRPKKYYTFVREAELAGKRCLISRTGYTGELGYEIYSAAEDIGAIWDLLMERGKDFGLVPCGLGARDTLRLEAAMPLYGHELSDTISPLEASLDFFVKLDCGDFYGRDAILAMGEPKRKRIGLEVTGRGIIREHCEVFDGDTMVGCVTSGTLCPYVNKAIGMAMLESAYLTPDTVLEVDVRGRRIPVKVVPLPFYKREAKK